MREGDNDAPPAPIERAAAAHLVERFIVRGYRYKMVPAPQQDAILRQFAGVCRLIYNIALEQRATWGRRYKMGYVSQAADLTRLRAEFD